MKRLPALLAWILMAAAVHAAGTGWTFTPDFRLTDTAGTTHELYYETSQAIVIVFTSAGSPRATLTSAALTRLSQRFAPGQVTLWEINSDRGTDRSTVTAEQKATADPAPVLLDDAQIVATEYAATRDLETVVIATSSWTVAYRGPLDDADPAGLAAPTQNFASDAAAAVVAGRAPASASVAMPAGARFLDVPGPWVPDYAKDVAPIVIRTCVQCHAAGNIAPFVYAAYADVQAHAAEIHADLLLRRMSPWHADAQRGVYDNSLALAPGDAATLYNWVLAGAPRGAGTDPLPAAAPGPAPAWPLGTPDLIVSIPPQSLPATGTVAYQYITVPLPLTSDTWMRAAVVKPGNTAVVHHALVFEGTLANVLAAAGGQGGYFAGYVPGLQQPAFPAGSGKLLKKGESITFQMHYITDGKPETDQTQIGFYFASQPPALTLVTASAYTSDITIPAGAPAYGRAATFMPSATKDVMLYNINPHMHYRGSWFTYQALYPDGSSEVLLNVPHYDFTWQTGYNLAQPKRLPAGTTIQVTGSFDNSAQNPANPDPTAVVHFGEQTTDEMFIGYINYAELPDLTAAPPVYGSNHAARGWVGQPLSVAMATARGTSYRADNLPAGLSINAASGTISGVPAAAGRSAVTVYATNTGGTAAVSLDLVVTAAAAAPAFAVQPVAQTVPAGGTVAFTAAIGGSGAVAYQWQRNGVNIAGANSATLVLSGAAAQAGTYTCVATTAGGSATSSSAQLALSNTSDIGRLANLSVLTQAGAGPQALTVGFAVTGSGSGPVKPLLVRAVGPGLASFGVSPLLADPMLTVFNGQTAVASNDDWSSVAANQTSVATTGTAVGAFALTPGSLDSALVLSVPGGSVYTVQTAGKGPAGLALTEVYDAASGSYAPALPRLVNLSCQSRLAPGATLTAGFVVLGSTSKTVLIRASGPALQNFGVQNVLPDPQLAVHATVGGQDRVLATNAGWGGDPQLATLAAAVYAFAYPNPQSTDSATVLTLSPGAYTVQVSSPSGASGSTLIEVYEVP